MLAAGLTVGHCGSRATPEVSASSGAEALPDGGAPEGECSVRFLDSIDGFVLRGCAWFRAEGDLPSEIGDLPPMAEVVGSATCVESEDEARKIADEFVAAHPPADDTYTDYELASVRRQGSMYRVRYDKVFRHGVKTEPHHCEVVVEPDGAIHWELRH